MRSYIQKGNSWFIRSCSAPDYTGRFNYTSNSYSFQHSFVRLLLKTGMEKEGIICNSLYFFLLLKGKLDAVEVFPHVCPLHRPDPSPLLVMQESRLTVFQINGKYSKKFEMSSTLPCACPPGACPAAGGPGDRRHILAWPKASTFGQYRF